jgi:hypothetical protein
MPRYFAHFLRAYELRGGGNMSLAWEIAAQHKGEIYTYYYGEKMFAKPHAVNIRASLQYEYIRAMLG